MTLDEYPIDDDYIGVDEQAADVSQSEEYRYDGSHTYDRSDGGMAGTARDVEIDRRTVTERDDRGGTRTGFDPNEVDEGKLSKVVIREGRPQKYSQWLLTLQDGFRSQERYVDNTKQDVEAYVKTFCSLLDMSPYQKKRVQAIVDSVNMKHMAHYPREVIVLSTISVVANEDDRWIRDEDEFKRLVTDLDTSMEDIKNARRLVKDKSQIT